MDYKQKQEELDCLGYNDLLIKSINYSYTDNSLEIIYNNIHNDVRIIFTKCLNIDFLQYTSCEKSSREIQEKNITTPYYLHSILIEEHEDSTENIYSCKIVAFPMTIDLDCTDILIREKVK